MFCAVSLIAAVVFVLILSVLENGRYERLLSENSELMDENMALRKLLKDHREALGRKHQLIEQIGAIANGPASQVHLVGYLQDTTKALDLIRTAIKEHGDPLPDRRKPDRVTDEPETKVNGHSCPEHWNPKSD